MCIRESVERQDANVVCCWSTIRRSVLHAHITTTTVSTINNHLHSHKENAMQQRRSFFLPRVSLWREQTARNRWRCLLHPSRKDMNGLASSCRKLYWLHAYAREGVDFLV
jgi:hypothetical protein